MSVENLEKFYALAFKNPSLAEAIQAAQAAGAENFVIIATELGKANGCSFTAQEAGDWIKAKSAAAAKGELNDVQLEAVAGGKDSPGGLDSEFLRRMREVRDAAAAGGYRFTGKGFL